METLRDPSFLSNARAQLDADHFGLEKIKKRLIEYLAVVRLKALQLEQDEKLEHAVIPSPGSQDQKTQVVQQSQVLAPSHNLKAASKVKGPILL